jgi:hypothetical protein
VTAELAEIRNTFVATLADNILVAYAQPGGKTEAFAREVLSWRKPLLTIDDSAIARLIELGAREIVRTVTPS